MYPPLHIGDWRDGRANCPYTKGGGLETTARPFLNSLFEDVFNLNIATKRVMSTKFLAPW